MTEDETKEAFAPSNTVHKTEKGGTVTQVLKKE